MAGPHTLDFTDDNFQTEVLESGQPVLVDFWAEWCQPCKALSPVIDEIATQYSGRAKVGKVDTETSQRVSMEYGISAIPTVLLFKGGELKARFVGLRSKKDFQTALDAALG